MAEWLIDQVIESPSNQVYINHHYTNNIYNLYYT